jgi:hypothetical protein
VYLSGVLGIEPSTNKLVDGNTAAQAKQAFVNLKHILEAANSSYGNGNIPLFSLFRPNSTATSEAQKQLYHFLHHTFHGGGEEFWLEDLKGRDYLEDLDVDGRIILE